ncbi:transcriptional regulator [Streptomyces griseocarneus]|nr:transcriptional regulator [Streptomyces griseocarneus]
MLPPGDGSRPPKDRGEPMALSLKDLLDLFPEPGGDFVLSGDLISDIPGVGELLNTWLTSADITVAGVIPNPGEVTVAGTLAFTVVDGPCPVVVSFTIDATQTVTGVKLDFTLPATEEDSGEDGDDFAPHLQLEASAQGFTATLVLAFTAANGDPKTMEFAASYQEGSLIGTWESEDGVSWDDIAHALGTAPADLPPALVPVLKRVGFAYEKRKKAFVLSAATEYVELVFASLPQKAGTGTAGARLRAVLLQGRLEAGLTDLPSIGDQAPIEDDLVFAGLQAFHLSAAMKVRKVKALNDLMSDTGVALGLPVRSLTAGASLAVTATTSFTEKTYGLVYPLRRKSQPGPVPPPRLEDEEDVPAQASIPLDAVFGPLRIAEIGLSYADGTARVTIDATFDAGGIELSASKLGFAIRIADGEWNFRPTLEGLGLSFDRPPVRIGGAFLVKEAQSPYDLLFAGMAVIEAKVVSVKVMGAYARAEGGYPSLFLYGVLAGRNGLGPPPFQVRGIAAGFGYNSSVRVPAPAETPVFPFVAELGSGSDRPPLEVLDDLLDGSEGRPPWLSPAQGQIWCAIGLDFTVFRLVDGKALALVEFGDDFTIAVLGLATASFPTGRPSDAAIARIQLAMQALYTSRGSMLALAAELTPASYVLDPECRLTGGLAYRTWFGGGHEGDFVFCLGGYAPGFDRPDHYPDVPRLGYTWGISSVVTVRGEAYAALTPAAVMAGGRLEVSFHAGIVEAWLTARLDALIQWKPFYFQLGVGVRIGFAVDLWLFTVRGEVGVDLDLWGPPVGGIATVHLWCIDFDVSFGAGRDPRAKEASWSDVQEQLPARDEMLRITPLAGILPEDETVRARRRARGDDRWVVSADGFSFSTATPVPASRITVGSTVVPGGKRLDIRPMGVTGLASEHTLTVRLGDDEGFDPVGRGWTVETVTSNVPQALWGTGDPDTERPTVPGQVIGLTVTVPGPQDGYSPGEMTDIALGFEELAPSHALPVTPGDLPTGPQSKAWQPGQEPTSIGAVATGIAATAVPARDALHAELVALGVAPPSHDRLDGFAALATAGTFTAEPLTI